MVSNYPKLPLEKVISIHDSKRKPIKKGDRISGPYPYYGASDIADYINDYVFDGTYLLLSEDGDNLRTRKTPIAFLAKGKFWVNNHAHVLQGEDELDTQFFCYALQYAEVDNYISGSTRPKITQADLKKIPVSAPPITTRREIAAFVKSLDDKITLNRQINQTLEQMAQTLFKSWFVDFAPVIDNALDAGNPIPDELQHRAEARKALRESEGFKPLPGDVRQLFPDAFEESELGWVPKGWGSGILSDLLVLQRGFGLPKSKRTDGQFPLMAASGQDGTHNEGKVRGPGVVTGRSGKLGVVNLVIEDFWPLNTTLWIKEYPRSNPYHAYFFLQTIPLEQFNSGSAVPTLNRNHVHNRPVTLPSQDVLNKYADLVKDNFTQILNRRIQSETLEKLRDTLLPKLISGELRLDDVEAAVEQETVSA